MRSIVRRSTCSKTNSFNVGSVERGILRLTAREFLLPKKKVCFASENVIHLIPARSPKLKIKHPPRTFIQPINVQSIMDEIYLRICNWSFKWIEVRFRNHIFQVMHLTLIKQCFHFQGTKAK